jgi:multidrug transporter EmrE-like cation transporter
MIKRATSASFLIFLLWGAIDYLLHGLLLKPTYEASAHLWRAQSEMNLLLIYLIVVILIVCFVSIYSLLISNKSLSTGVAYGALSGLATGVGVGFGTYIHMPVPLALAWGWCLGGWLKGIVAGAIVGAMVKPSRAAPNQAL